MSAKTDKLRERREVLVQQLCAIDEEIIADLLSADLHRTKCDGTPVLQEEQMSGRSDGLWSDRRPAYSLVCPYGTSVVFDCDSGELFFRPLDQPSARITLAENLRILAAELEDKPL